jgi:hypothetical protein
VVGAAFFIYFTGLMLTAVFRFVENLVHRIAAKPAYYALFFSFPRRVWQRGTTGSPAHLLPANGDGNVMAFPRIKRFCSAPVVAGPAAQMDDDLLTGGIAQRCDV